MKKKYIIFDFDGTLVNTNDVIIESWQATYEKYLGHRVPVSDIISSFGEILMTTIKRTMPGVDVQEAVAYYRQFQADHCDELVHVYEGIPELLRELRNRGCKIGVATSRTKEGYDKYMEDLGLADLVDAAATMDDVVRHKPHPDTVNKVLEKLGATPDEAIMVGDSRYDTGCAMNAGVDSVLVEWSHEIDEEELEESGFLPTYRIKSPLELLDII